jgi:hypothetical protein
MAVTRDILFNINDAAKNAGTVSIPTSAAWNAGVVFNRTNAIPIDKFSVFDSYGAAESYALTSPIAYPGQLIAVVPENDRARGYIILADGTIKELGVDIDITPLEANIADLQSKAITNISNLGSTINYTKYDGSTSSFNTTWVGTRAEYNTAYATGQIPIGTIVVITDEPDDDEVVAEGASSPILGKGVLGYLVLG